MRLLLLGGTVFLGRALAEAALARGDEVTLFTRGQSNPGLFPGAERLTGDRRGDLSALEGREWDVVIDTSGYEPDEVRASVAALNGSVERYVFVSSISVYADFSRGPDEDAPLRDGDDYGGAKARCEHELPDGSLVVRPGLIAGPHDPTGRFTYWAHRGARGGELLVPGSPERQVQLIDVRDLAAWMLRLADERRSGVLNATGTHTWRELVDALPGEATPVWVDDAFLLEQGVGEWMELPLWIASATHAGMLDVDASRAHAAGLTVRPLAETARAALEHAELSPEAGLSAEREHALLAAWRSR